MPQQLVIVDIQPGHLAACQNVLVDVVNKLNTTRKEVYFIFNDEELGYDTEHDVRNFLWSYGIKDNKLDTINFIPKQYGFFRGWMDTGIEDKTIVNAVRKLKRLNKWDSRDLPPSYLSRLGLDREADSIGLPSWDIDFIDSLNGSVEICGGGRNECLKEIELLFKAYGIRSHRNETLCYGG